MDPLNRPKMHCVSLEGETAELAGATIASNKLTSVSKLGL